MTRALPALLALSLVAMACPGAQRRTTRFDHRRGAGAPTPTSTSTSTGTEPGTPPAPPLIVRREERVVELEVKGAPVRLNATATWPTLDDEVIEGPVFLLVPGAGVACAVATASTPTRRRWR
jgi:hypothetical protein